MKCGACARLRHQIRRAGAKPKPTPSEAEQSFGSIRTAKSERTGTQGSSPVWRTGLRPVFQIDFENAAESRVFRFIRLEPSGFAFADDSETEIVAGEIREVGAASGRAQTGEARFPTATAINALGSARGSVRISLRRRFVLLKEIAAPFPDISRHILNPERTGPARR